jgi:hypothetical protein
MIRLISVAVAVVLLAAGSLSLALAQDPPKPIGRYGDSKKPATSPAT